MSIWCSEDVAGEDEHDNYDGSVVSYINGWSNHYPGVFPPLDQKRGPVNDLTVETPATIGVGWMPAWCVPGRDDVDEMTHDVDTHLGPWLRLDVTMRTVSIWAGVEIGNMDVHSVCLNEDAVVKLRNDLDRWLQRSKIYPPSCESISVGKAAE